MWIPKSPFSNDSTLMEIASKDKLLQRKGKMEVINNCRMYIGATFISDLLKDERCIDKRFLNGTKKVSKHIERFREIRQPPDAAWSEWKAFIFRNFLINGYEVFPPLTQQSDKISQRETRKTEKEQLEHMTYGSKLHDTVNRLPRELTSILHTIEYPGDDGIDLAFGILEGKVYGACDGSLKQEKHKTKGGFGYTIQLKDTDKISIKGWSPTPLSNNMTSLTSEFFGALATLLIVFSIYCQYKEVLHFESVRSTMIIWIDNKETMTRVSATEEKMNVSETLIPEYDIEQLTKEIIKLLPFKVTLKWVKSHQNETKEGKTIYGPFPREVQLNCEVDELAKKGLELKPAKRQIYTHTIAGIYDATGVLATDISKYLYSTINGPPVLEYVGKKFNWEEEEVNSVNWEAVGLVMKSYSQYQRNKAIQLMYDWQNDGA